MKKKFEMCIRDRLYVVIVIISYLACFSIYSNGGTSSVILVIS